MSKGEGASPSEAAAAASGGAGALSRRGDGIGHGKPSSSSSDSTPMRRNPFYAGRGGRNNFPDLDIALNLESPPNDRSTSSPQLVDEDDDDDDDDDGSSILNLSIGARAALNEHLRHVERFGIDGDCGHTARNKSQHGEDGFAETDTQILDDHWETLLNSSRVDSSSSVAGATVPSTLSRLDNIMYADSAAASEESIEVMTDACHDFFNSSRVQLLTTPERNKSRQIDMVTTRDEVHEGGALFDNSMYGSEANSSTCYLSRYARDMHVSASNHRGARLSESGVDTSGEEDRNSSFQSFNAAEISGISNAYSGAHRTPNTSFQVGLLTIDDGGLSPIVGGICSPGRNVDTSFSSLPTRRDATGRRFVSPDDHNCPRFPASAATINAVAGRGGLHSHQREVQRTRQKENVSPDINASNSVHSTVSSFIADACSLMKNVANEVELSIGALENFPSDFLKAIENAGRPSDPPSPISQVESTASSSQEKSSSKRMGEGPSSMHAVSAASNLPLTGRKRFRTVVPRRVYLDSEGTFDEEHDSFLAVQSNPETGTHKSLIESLETHGHNTF